MPSRVLHVPAGRITGRIGAALDQTGFLAVLKRGTRVAIKTHFGEAGNNNHLEPAHVREVVDALPTDCVPELIETTTLYRGERHDAASHAKLARSHGFTRQATGAPVRIVDGRRGEAWTEVPVPGARPARVARGLRRYPAIVFLSHFKGHMVTGFGGALKNAGMGLAAKGGKLDMHSRSKPRVRARKCTGCEDCLAYCPHGAIAVAKGKARIRRARCVGCCGCFVTCTPGAIGFDWDSSSRYVQRRMADYAYAATAGRATVYLNLAVRVTKNCDCISETEEPLMPDVGLFASRDPVACDQACFNRTRDALTEVWPKLNPELQLVRAEQLGLGTRRFTTRKLS